MNNKIYALLLCISLLGCVYTENQSTANTFLIKIENDVDVELIAGDFNQISATPDHQIIQLDFTEVKGGETLLFGFIPIHKTDGNTYKRLRLLHDNEIHSIYSIEDLNLCPKSTFEGKEIIDFTSQ